MVGLPINRWKNSYMKQTGYIYFRLPNYGEFAQAEDMMIDVLR